MKACRWWSLNRWTHRRLRRADMRIMVPRLIANCRMLAPNSHVAASRAFVHFIYTCGGGQAHWLCDCARSDIATVQARLDADLPAPE